MRVLDDKCHYYDADEDCYPLKIVARHGCVKTASILLDHGAKADFMDSDDNRNSPLHEASSWPSVEMVRFLIEKGGCDPNL